MYYGEETLMGGISNHLKASLVVFLATIMHIIASCQVCFCWLKSEAFYREPSWNIYFYYGANFFVSHNISEDELVVI